MSQTNKGVMRGGLHGCSHCLHPFHQGHLCMEPYFVGGGVTNCDCTGKPYPIPFKLRLKLWVGRLMKIIGGGR